MKTPDEIIEAHPDAFWEGVQWMQTMLAAVAAMEQGDPAAAEADPRCNPWTIGCPS